MTTTNGHAWTTHGHACCDQPGPMVGDRPLMIARCGGPAICAKCATEAAVAHAQSTPEAVTYDPPQPNAALVVGPDDVLVLSFSTMTLRERDHFRSELPENLRDRVLFVAGADDVAVLRGGAK